MNVLYDHQIFEMQNIGGISRYFTELIKHNQKAKLSLKYSDNFYLNDKYFADYKFLPKNYEYNKFLPFINFKGKKRLYNHYSKITKDNNKSISINNLKHLNYDIFHPTYYNPYFINYIKSKPFIITVHDMIHEIFPQYFLNDKKIISYKRLVISSADTIIAISENTKRDILKYFPDLYNKIKVVYHGSSFQQLNSDKNKENFILFTGERKNYKNFNTFVKAVASLLKKYDLSLICTGHPFTSEEKELLENLNITNKTKLKLTSDEELSKLYSKAIAFVFPSIYEGFGIPVLEAFASGCPTILSNTGSLPEIGGNASLYFDPYSMNDMQNKIENVITSPMLQGEMIKKGHERLKLFSWEKCVEETIKIYKECT